MDQINMMNKQIIIDFVLSSGGRTSEYLLLQFLQEHHSSFFSSLGDDPSLYKKHFFLFHQLYLLRDELVAHRKNLLISAIEITISDQIFDSKAIADTDALREFYLDLKNLALSDEKVSEMLNDFWQKYLAIDKKAQAIRILGLDNSPTINKKIIKKRYNELASKHHPDKGGNQQEFIKIKQANETLKKLFN